MAAGFCPKNLAFARKIMGLPESGGLQPPAPWLVRGTPMDRRSCCVQLRGLQVEWNGCSRKPAQPTAELVNPRSRSLHNDHRLLPCSWNQTWPNSQKVFMLN